MKLNKKGFGVAEIAIVILLIGILAAAVIVGFMGIKKNATEHVKEEATKSIEIINQTKHAYPSTISKNQQGLVIKEGEYEVYEMGGNKLIDGGSGVYPLVVKEGATLYISGNGTTDEMSKIDGTAQPKQPTVDNYGKLYISDLIITGGDRIYANREYQFCCNAGSETTLDNVVVSCGTRAVAVAFDAILTIDGVNSRIQLGPSDGATGQYLFYALPRSVITLNNGTYTCKQQHNTMFYSVAGKTIINGGYFTDTLNSANVGNYQIFYFASYRVDEDTLLTPTVEINGGVFDCTVCNCSGCSKKTTIAFFYFYGSSSVTITGGEFIKAPPRFASGVNQTNRKLVITDAPNDGTEQLIFHYAPDVGKDGGWGQYVAEGYEWYVIEEGARWGVRPVTTP